MKPKPPEQRFWPKVDRRNDVDCWTWTAAIANTGYGIFNAGPSAGLVSAHRFAYELLVGPIPSGLHLDHLCMNKACCNPKHLEPVTPGENARRAEKIGHDHPNAPTTCARGHDWKITPPYLAKRSDGTVSRLCRRCTRMNAQVSREAKHGTAEFFQGLRIIQAAAQREQTLTVETTRAAFDAAGISNRRVAAIWTAAQARNIVRLKVPAAQSDRRSVHGKRISRRGGLMGMYTEIVLGVELVRDVPESVVEVLRLMVEPQGAEPALPNHPLFNAPRWGIMLRCDSYYFAGDTRSTLRFDEIASAWMLTVRSNFKNYDNEIDLFIDWLAPFVQTRGFAGYWRYEEFDEPVSIRFGDPS